jgi:hypothetical protein
VASVKSLTVTPPDGATDAAADDTGEEPDDLLHATKKAEAAITPHSIRQKITFLIKFLLRW